MTTMSHPDRLAIESVEKWFVSHGLPHFIADYSASRDIFTRAAPILSLIFLIEVFGALNLEWTVWANLASIAAGFAILIAAWSAANASRGRPLLARPERFGTLEIGIFVLVPALLPMIFGGQFVSAVTTTGLNLCLLLFIYAGTSYGIVPMVLWAVGHMLRQFGHLFDLLVRTLPLLLLFVTFLFINAEVWQVGAGLTGAALAGVVALFVVLGTLFVATRLPRELARLNTFGSWDDVRRLTLGTPAEDVAAATGPVPQVMTPSRRQWINVGLVALFSQGVQIIFVSLLIGGFFVGFGMLAIDTAVIESWTGGPVHEVAVLSVAGRDIVLSQELLRVAVFLAGFSGLYFTVSAVTDTTYREEFYEEVVGEVRRAFAVRQVYLTAFLPPDPDPSP